MGEKTILDYETVDLDIETDELVIIDQTLLPGKTEIIRLKTAQEIWDAIYLLKVRGAPAIGVAAAFGIYILAKQIAVEHNMLDEMGDAGVSEGQSGSQEEAFQIFYTEFIKQKAKEFGGEDEILLNSMIDKYPTEVSKDEIITFITSRIND